jgi:hypothetical protein
MGLDVCITLMVVDYTKEIKKNFKKNKGQQNKKKGSLFYIFRSLVCTTRPWSVPLPAHGVLLLDEI